MENPPYQISWYIPDRVLSIKVVGNLIVDEVLEMQTEVYKQISQAPDIVHALVDLRESTTQNQHMRQAFNAVNREHVKNRGTTILVIPPHRTISQVVVSMIFNALGLRFKIYSNMEDAEAAIARLEKRRKKGKDSAKL